MNGTQINDAFRCLWHIKEENHRGTKFNHAVNRSLEILEKTINENRRKYPLPKGFIEMDKKRQLLVSSYAEKDGEGRFIFDPNNNYTFTPEKKAELDLKLKDFAEENKEIIAEYDKNNKALYEEMNVVNIELYKISREDLPPDLDNVSEQFVSNYMIESKEEKAVTPIKLV